MAVAQEFAVAEVAQHPQQGSVAAAVIGAAALAIFIDGTASATITAGLPYVQGVAGSTPDESSWIVTAFNAPYYATILFSPWLYARFGRKPLLLGGLIGFAATSILLALANSYPTIVALRVFQGMTLGCVFVPVVLLFFTSLSLSALRLAVPAFALMVLTAGALGTLVGGYLSETYGAAAIYLPGAFLALFAALLIWSYAPGHDAPQPNLKPDTLGYLLSLLAFGALQYLANEGERRNWFDDPSVVVATVLLAFSALMFVTWELLYARHPHANFRLFSKYRNLLVGGVINLVLGVLGYAVTLFSAYLQTANAATITLAGEVIALRTLTYVFGVLTGFVILSRRLIDVRIVVAVAAIGTSICYYGFACQMTTIAEAASFIGITLLFGFFFALLSQPVPSLVVGALPLGDLPHGVAIYKLTVPIGLSAGTAIIGSFVDHRVTFQSSHLAGALTLGSPAVSDFVAHGGSLTKLGGLLLQQAQAIAYQDAMVVMCCITLLIIPLIVFAVPPGPPPPRE